jgi:hypothetical protein
MTRRNWRPPFGSVNEPRLRLREPVDVLAAIPYLVGYHPTESIILLGMQGKQLTFTARYDLPKPDAPRSETRFTVEHMLGVVAQQDLTGVLIVGFGSDDVVAPLALTLRDACSRFGLDVLEVLRADCGRYWSYLCTDPLCCPPDGSPYDAGTSAVAAAWTVAGRVALPDRETYERQLRPVVGVDRVAVRQATAVAGEELLALLRKQTDEQQAEEAITDRAIHAIDRGLSRLRAGQELGADDIAWLSVLAASSVLREMALKKIRTAGDELRLHRTLWMDVLRRAERDLTPAPGCLFAFAAWRCGEGALARLALERVLRVDPHESMAGAMYHLLSHGLPPSAFDEPGPVRVRRRPAQRRRKRSSSRRAGSRRG